MQELDITQSMFDVVVKHAEQAEAKKVTKVNLVIGEMTGVVNDCLQLCLQDFQVKETEWLCPGRGGTSLGVTGGTGPFVENIEVE